MNNSEEFKNNSKTVLAYTLNNKSINGTVESGKILDERELLIDIFLTNQNNITLDFTFSTSGLAKIKKNS